MITLVTNPKDFLFVFVYYLVYNISVFGCFLIICRAMHGNFRTLSEIKSLTTSPFATFSFVVVLLSMAGVPPFLGFFSKVLIIKSLLNAGQSFFFIFFLVIVFIALFFYMQNVRFILSPQDDTTKSSLSAETTAGLHLTLVSVIINVILIFGAFYLSDIFILVAWLLY